MLTVLAVRRNSPCSGPALDFGRHRLGKIALGHRADDPRHFAGGMNQIADQPIDRPDRFRPAVGHVPKRGALRDAPFLAHDLADPVEFLGHALVDADDLVKGIGDLSRQSRPVIRQPDGEIATFECGKRGEKLLLIEAVRVEARAILGGLEAC